MLNVQTVSFKPTLNATDTFKHPLADLRNRIYHISISERKKKKAPVELCHFYVEFNHNASQVNGFSDV